jgi:hypothetical protein
MIESRIQHFDEIIQLKNTRSERHLQVQAHFNRQIAWLILIKSQLYLQKLFEMFKYSFLIWF